MDQAHKELKKVMDGMQEQQEHETIIKNAATMLLFQTGSAQSGSRVGRAANIDRNRQASHDRIVKDYFADKLVYTNEQFRRRFRMHCSLFHWIEEAVVAHDNYFVQKRDALGLLALFSIQKIVAALCMLAYGNSADSLDEYIRIGETTAIECLKRFCIAVVDVFKMEYLRKPSVEDTERILKENEAQGFLGMIGSIDCMHWAWKNCPCAWAGQYKGRHKYPTIVLEAVASYDLWIWHAFFGMPGSNNDVNVLQRSHVFFDQVEGVAPRTTFRVNENLYS